MASAVDQEGRTSRMQPGDSTYQGYLAELNRLAGRLFDLVRQSYDCATEVILHLDRSDRLMPRLIEGDDIVAATLFCAQLLRRATADPETARPRHVVGLTDFVDQLIRALLETRPPDRAAQALRSIHDRIGDIALSLAVLADPGAPDYR